MLRLLFLGLLCSLSFNLKGQDYYFHHFTADEGMPSSSTYHVVQDEQGIIYISTDNGLCLFDGLKFKEKVFPTLVNEYVVGMLIDKNHGFWVNTLEGEILYKEEETFKSLEEDPTFKGETVEGMFEAPNGEIWFFPRSRNLICYKEGQFEKYPFPFKGTKRMAYHEGRYYCTSQHNLSILENNKVQETFLLPDNLNKPGHCVFEEGIFIFQSSNNLFQFDPATKKVESFLPEYQAFFANKINYLYRCRKGYIWVTTQKGLLQIKKKAGEYEVRQILNNHFVSIYEDAQGNYWLTSRKKGIFLLPAALIDIYTTRSGLKANTVVDVEIDSQGNTLIGYENQNPDILNLKGNLIKNHGLKLPSTQAILYDISAFSDNTTYIASSEGISKFNGINEGKKIFLKSGKRIYEDKNGMTLICGSFTTDYIIGDTLSPIIKKRAYAALAKDTNSVLLGTTNGLVYYDGQTTTAVEHKLLNTYITDIEEDSEGITWVGTKNNGLVLLKNRKFYKKLDIEDGLSSNLCNDIEIDETSIWLGTNQGIDKIDRKNHKKIQRITKAQGLGSNEIFCLKEKGDKIYAATNNGLAIFNKNQVKEEVPPELILLNMLVNRKDTVLLNRYELKPFQRNVQIDYQGLYYKAPQELIYEYKMEGLDDDWKQTNNNSIEFSSLPWGDYQFKIRCKTPYSKWGEELQVNLIIATPIYRKMGFWILVALMGIILMGLIIYGIVQMFKRRDYIDREMKIMELKALRARLNPHFMFNSLNAIQDFILNNDKRSANRYLSKFSRLMRQILQMSAQNKIKLDEEIEALELYLELEALRFEEDFIYEINVDPEIDTEYLEIPSLLVQPYVENAIKHGLLHKKGKKSVQVRFKLEDKFLHCIVEDNGVGRKRASEIQKNNQEHVSVGMQLNKDRLKILNASSDNDLSVNVEDLSDENGQSTGTRVSLFIYII